MVIVFCVSKVLYFFNWFSILNPVSLKFCVLFHLTLQIKKIILYSEKKRKEADFL